jgi:hypothetical protein
LRLADDAEDATGGQLASARQRARHGLHRRPEHRQKFSAGPPRAPERPEVRYPQIDGASPFDRITGRGKYPKLALAVIRKARDLVPQSTVRVDLSDRQETMTMSVVVPNEHDEGAVREFGIARAKDFARGFAELRSANF